MAESEVWWLLGVGALLWVAAACRRRRGNAELDLEAAAARVVALAVSGSPAPAAADADYFSELLQRYDVYSRVRLFEPPGGERGLFTTESVRANEPLLMVPFEICLVCETERDNAIKSPWDAPNRDDSDTLLARQLLAASFDQSGSDDSVVTPEQQVFWQDWGRKYNP